MAFGGHSNSCNVYHEAQGDSMLAWDNIAKGVWLEGGTTLHHDVSRPDVS